MKVFPPKWPVRRLCIVIIFISVLPFGKSDNVYNAGDIRCTQQLETLDKPGHTDSVIANCPNSCLDGFCRVRGSSPYTASSSICCAAIHHGSIDNNLGGQIHIKINHQSVPAVHGSPQHGIKSRQYDSSSRGTFTFVPMRRENLETLAVMSQLTNQVQTTLSTVATATRKNKQDIYPQMNEFALPVKSQPSTVSMTSRTHGENSRSSTLSSRSQNSQNITADAGSDNQNNTHFSVYSISLLHFILLLIGILLLGMFLTLNSVFVWKKIFRPKERKKKCCSGSKVKSSSRSEDPEVCVCYQNLNTSRQGLLTDPETCDRPCPMKSLTDNQLDYVTVEQELLRHDKEKTKNDQDGCEKACSKKCCPEKFEF